MMDITTGVFTAITSGHYIITYSASADLVPGKSIYISIHHNGNPVREGSWWSFLGPEGGISHMVDQGSRTVVGSSYKSNYNSAPVRSDGCLLSPKYILLGSARIKPFDFILTSNPDSLPTSW